MKDAGSKPHRDLLVLGLLNGALVVLLALTHHVLLDVVDRLTQVSGDSRPWTSQVEDVLLSR